jgi:hypothetical protein
LSIAGPALGPPVTVGECRKAGFPEDLASLLASRNGFFAFESALHIRPLEKGQRGDVSWWNEDERWRQAYSGWVRREDHFFAEDVFGGQFMLREGAIFSFDPETGEIGLLANNMEQWAREILSDFEFLTGHGLAHEWQALHGPIPSGCRLVPKVPFVLGGEFCIENLSALDSVKGMLFRADIARQIRDLPDGAEVELKVID